MKKQKNLRGILITVLIICLAAGGYWFYSSRRTHPAASAKAKTEGGDAGPSSPVASVKVVPLRMGRLSADITAYGDVVPAPGAIQVASVPYESRVLHVMVSGGQKVSKGDALAEVEASPDTLLALEQARTANDIAGQKLAHVKELFTLKLATNTQVLQVEEAARQASAKLESLEKRGVDGRRIVRSMATGLAGNVYIREGAIVGAGNPLVDIIARDRLEVRLGVEPDEVRRLASGQSVRLNYVNVPGTVQTTGTIRKISRAVNQATRLVDVFVKLPPSSGYLLGEYILARIRTSSSYGLVVPRSAVLPEGANYVLFTVRNGRAVRHNVKMLLENDEEAQISAPGLKPGELAVVLGNYELKDGIAVRATESR